MSPGEKSDRSENSGRRDREPDAAGRASAGAMLREARLAAGLDAIRMAADLRISAQAFEALETGQYHLLPGDPYVRALLSSLARHLHLDPQLVVQTYMNEMGVAPAPGQVAPYQDKGEIHSNSHRKFLIGLMVLLLVGFVVVLKQLNRPDQPFLEAMSPAPQTVSDLDSSLASVAEDTLLLESRSLLPDTVNDSLGTVEGRTVAPSKATNLTKPMTAVQAVAAKSPRKDSVKAALSNPVETLVEPAAAGETITPGPVEAVPTPNAKVDTSSKPGSKASLPEDTAPQKMGSGNHKAVLQAQEDSLWVKVMREDKPDDIRLLQKGKSLHISYTDTIRIALSKKGVLAMTLDGKPIQATRKRFKVMGQLYRPY